MDASCAVDESVNEVNASLALGSYHCDCWLGILTDDPDVYTLSFNSAGKATGGSVNTKAQWLSLTSHNWPCLAGQIVQCDCGVD